MSKIAVVFWTGTGNTSTMATAVVEGIKEAGAEAELIAAADFGAAKVKEYDGIAFGCPAMGDEVLEESEFAPMFDECKPELPGKKVALFGSYGWGTGEWMETMFVSNQLGLYITGAWLMADLNTYGINYGVTTLIETPEGGKQAPSNTQCFMVTSSASDEEALAACKALGAALV